MVFRLLFSYIMYIHEHIKLSSLCPHFKKLSVPGENHLTEQTKNCYAFYIIIILILKEILEGIQ